jgi:tryptophan halogenase
MAEARRPTRYVIAGSGIAGAMTALALASRLPTGSHSITVLRDGEDADAGFGRIVATRPDIRRFHAGFGVDEDALLRAGAASFTLGTAYSGWSPIRATYFLPYGDAGASIDGVPFHLLAARLRAEGEKVALADYSVAALMAQSGRFARPSDDPRSVLSTFSYGLHLDVIAYADALFGLARQRGAIVVRDALRSVEVADGRIEALHPARGERLVGDVFIDATGARGALVGSLPGGEFIGWNNFFPFDRVVLAKTRASAAPAAYAHVAAQAEGWRLTVPAGLVVGESFAYSSQILPSDQAERLLLAKCAGELISTPRHEAIEAGKRTPWNGNCVAVGTATATVEPLHSMPFSLLQNGVDRLLRLLPASVEMEAEANEYNRATAEEIDRARDLALLPYRLNGRSGESIWDHTRQTSRLGELERKIALYRSRGRVPLLDGDLLDEADWAALFDGHGVTPERTDTLAEAIPLDRLTGQLARMRQVMIQAIAPLPSHGDYLRQLTRGAAAA